MYNDSMSDIEQQPSRAGMSREEREVRSKLRQLFRGNPGLLRGTLAVREVTCGKPSCKCAQGERHTSHVLVASYEGRPRQLYVPASIEAAVRQWVARHHEIRELLERLSRIHWERVKRREV